MKKAIFALPLAAMMMACAVQAADPIEKQVQVVAQVPTAAFYVEPIGDWINDPQVMTYRQISSSFDSIRQQFQAKSTIGPITAHLLSPAVISSGIDTINLNVRVGTTDLSTTPAEVLTATQAAPGTVMDFVVSAIAPPSGSYNPGTYQGLVNMMFETAAP